MMRSWIALMALMVGCGENALRADPGECPDPPDVGTLCADVEGLGVLEMGVLRADRNELRAGTDDPAAERDGVNLEFVGADGEILEGSYTCAADPVLVDFGENVGAANGGVRWTADQLEGTCTITVDDSGVLGAVEITGTFEAVLTRETGQTRDINGSFHAPGR